MGTGPLVGIVARVAVHTNFFAVAHAKSFTWSATRCHVSQSPAAVATPGPTSLSPTIVVIESEPSTFDKRSRAVAVRTSLGFCNTPVPDRKSTRLNSSHSQISYAVFCLKKKKKKQ